mmetsp:Transcript_20938/g.37302  ORF Transcript_20938/g.37302 Transcript_20938/m.37302 type:complete len:267 (-) Transcript_20938:352-1152(-)
MPTKYGKPFPKRELEDRRDWRNPRRRNLQISMMERCEFQAGVPHVKMEPSMSSHEACKRKRQQRFLDGERKTILKKPNQCKRESILTGNRIIMSNTSDDSESDCVLEAEAILKTRRNKSGQLECLVKWRGLDKCWWKLEEDLPVVLIAAESSGSQDEDEDPEEAYNEFEIGEKIQARWLDNQWYDAVVAKCYCAYYRVTFDIDGTWEDMRHCDLRRIDAKNPSEGDSKEDQTRSLTERQQIALLKQRSLDANENFDFDSGGATLHS